MFYEKNQFSYFGISIYLLRPCQPPISWFPALFVFRCGTAQFKSILDYICQLEEEVVELKEKITDYSVANRRHEEICGNDDLITASKLNTMNDKVRLIISLLFCLH